MMRMRKAIELINVVLNGTGSADKNAGKNWVGKHGRTWSDICKALSVGRPQHHDLIEASRSFELAYISSDAFQMVLFGAGLHTNVNTKHKTPTKQKQNNGDHQHIIGTVALVGGDEIWVVDRWPWTHGLHEGSKLLLKRGFENARARHAVGEIHGRYVPAVDCNVVGVDLSTSHVNKTNPKNDRRGR